MWSKRTSVQSARELKGTSESNVLNMRHCRFSSPARDVYNTILVWLALWLRKRQIPFEAQVHFISIAIRLSMPLLQERQVNRFRSSRSVECGITLIVWLWFIFTFMFTYYFCISLFKSLRHDFRRATGAHIHMVDVSQEWHVKDSGLAVVWDVLWVNLWHDI